MEKYNKNKKAFSDETTELRILKKQKKSYILEDDDLKSLQETREFRKIESKDGKLISRYSPKIENGLTLDQVQERRENGLINKTKNKYEKTVSDKPIKFIEVNIDYNIPVYKIEDEKVVIDEGCYTSEKVQFLTFIFSMDLILGSFLNFQASWLYPQSRA